MSVLACTIGALMVLLVAMSLAAVGVSDAATRAYASTREMTDAERQAVEADRKRLSQAEALWAEVDAALEAHGLDAGLSSSSIEQQLDQVRERFVLAKILDEAQTSERELDHERETIETTISVLQNRRETLPILIDSTGLARHLEPYFVECDAGGVTAYRAKDDFRYFVPRDELSTSGDFGRYLRRVRVSPGALLVLLVRPDGIATTEQASRIALAAGIRVATLPLPGKGKLDWSLLRRAEGEGR